jgi:chromosome segregation ATPase
VKGSSWDDAPVPSSSQEEPEPLAEAYERRDAQLHEARAALAEAVAALERELKLRREEADGLRSELAGAREHAANLAAEAEKQRRLAVQHAGEVTELREEVARLAAELGAAQEMIATLRGMKAVRWTAAPRRLAHRLRRR